MEPIVFFAILGAAIMHAGWNSVVKIGGDRFSAVLLLSFVQSGLALLLLPFVPLPAPEAWFWVGLSALLHTGYKLFLVGAYAHADLSQAYPLARGTAPLIVTVVTAAALGATFSGMELLAIGLISSGVLLMAFRGGAGGGMPVKGLAFALGTALFTASYTLADGVGARAAGTASGFFLWMAVGDGIAMLCVAMATRGRACFPAMLPQWRMGLLAGVLSLGAYWIAVWGFTRAPIALVAALRESSIFFAVLISALVLRERVSLARWASAGLIVLGIAAMRL